MCPSSGSEKDNAVWFFIRLIFFRQRRPFPRYREKSGSGGPQSSALLSFGTADFLNLINGRLATAHLFINQLASDFHLFSGTKTC